MNRTECKTWIEYHCVRFPKVREWFAALGDTELATVIAWHEVLQHTALGDAMAASQEMFKHTDEYRLRAKEDTPSIVAGVACRLAEPTPEPRRRYVDGERTYQCPRCRDDSYVDVFRFGASASYRTMKGEPKPQDAGLLRYIERTLGHFRNPLRADSTPHMGPWTCVVMCDCKPVHEKCETPRWREEMLLAFPPDWDGLAESTQRIGGVQATFDLETHEAFDKWAP